MMLNGIGSGDWGGEVGPPDVDTGGSSGSSSGSSSSSPFWTLINTSLTTAGNIFTRRYGNPDVPAGTVIRNADGSTYIQQASGYPVTPGGATQYPVGGTIGGGGGSGVMLLGLVVVVGAMVLLRSTGSADLSWRRK